MKKILVSMCILLSSCLLPAEAQNAPKQSSSDLAPVERELRQFYDAYAQDLGLHRREAIGDRYDPRGYFALGNGSKRFVPFEENEKRYMTNWTGPKKFEWRDMTFENLAPNSAAVVGRFDWIPTSGEKETGSYTAMLTKRSGQWRIRVDDESFNSTGYSIKVISGDRDRQSIF